MADWLARAATAIPASRDSPAADKGRQWRIGYPSLPAITVQFTPAVTRAEVAEMYPGADIEPVSVMPSRAATVAEADELRRLIGAILAADTDADRAEALAVALADPEAALASYRALAANGGGGRIPW